MKKTLTLICMTLALYGKVYAQYADGWNYKNPTVPAADYTALNVVNANLVFMAGSGGMIQKSTDGGRTWSRITPPYLSRQDEPIYDISFVDEQTGYAVGDTFIVKTTDGGNTWTSVTQVEPYYLRLVSFTDADHGYRLRMYGFEVTADGGTNWTTVALPDRTGNDKPGNISMTGITTGYLTLVDWDRAKLYTTSNGSTWTRMNTPTKNFKYVSFYNDQTGCIFGDGDSVYVTSNGGTTWTGSKADVQGDKNSVAWLDANTAVISSKSYGAYLYPEAQFAKSTDAGLTWTAMSIPRGLAGANAIRVLGNGELIAVGESGSVLHTTGGATAWGSTSGAKAFNFSSIVFKDANTGVSSGDNGKIYYTADGGHTWNEAATNPEFTIHTLAFTTGNNVIGMGTGGFIYHSSDNGQNWSTGAYSYYNGTLFDLAYRPATGKIFAVGQPADKEDIVYSSDGGVTWNEKIIPGIYRLNRMWFADEQTIFCGGKDTTDHAVLIKSSDGGETWTRMNLSSPVYYSSVSDLFFTNGGTAWAAGTHLWKSTDGGENWATVTNYDSTVTTDPYNNPDMHAVYFSSADTGYVAGGAGFYMYTTDGGVTWNTPNLGSNHTLSRFTRAADELFLCGAHGQVLSKRISGSSTGVFTAAKVSALTVYPNPTEGRFTLPANDFVRVEVSDLMGRRVLTSGPVTAGASIDLGGHPAGTYLVRAATADGIFCTKVVLK